MNRNTLAALMIATTLWLAAPAAQAQNGSTPQVSVVTLQVVQNADGSQSVITPKGDLATLPGAGVNGSVAQIYMGAQGGFWYTDRNGQTVDLDPTVRSLQARRARAAQTAQVPQYAPQPYYQGGAQAYGQPAPQGYAQPPQQQVTVEQAPAQEETSSGSGGGGGRPVASALGTAAAAAGGAMLGSAMTNGYYNAPYGTPMYYGPRGAYYYGNGERYDLDDVNLTPNQKAYMYNQRTLEQQNKQQVYQNSQANQQARMQQSSTNQQSRQESMTQNQAQRQAAYGGTQSAYGGTQSAYAGAQHDNFQKQQQWYQDQMKQNPQRFQQASANPFVAQQGSSGDRESKGLAERKNGGDGGSERGGRFSRGDGDGGGRFAGRESGGRFAGRESGGGFSRGGGGRARGGGGRRR